MKNKKRQAKFRLHLELAKISSKSSNSQINLTKYQGLSTYQIVVNGKSGYNVLKVSNFWHLNTQTNSFNTGQVVTLWTYSASKSPSPI